MSAKVRPKVTRLKRKRRLLTWMAAGKETTAQVRPVLGPISREVLETPVGTPKRSQSVSGSEGWQDSGHTGADVNSPSAELIFDLEEA